MVDLTRITSILVLTGLVVRALLSKYALRKEFNESLAREKHIDNVIGY